MQAGEGPVLVRIGPSGLTRLAADPTLADIALIDLPAPGFALLRGDVPRIRAAFGLAVAWKGRPACLPRPHGQPRPANS
ncbi:hypothetical protein [Roseicella aerolata]|uniref:Uncharacterized protein n=1 Tax=Roseicella aerolata TaxID=2883479 RepID=A0A9X1L809_9PROT|nr:hypothetical protein [Roseicella aerolata]MCB4822536.1 hypothetical protein [Roseicella aerolata]